MERQVVPDTADELLKLGALRCFWQELLKLPEGLFGLAVAASYKFHENRGFLDFFDDL